MVGAWEMRDVEIGPGGNPPDKILTKTVIAPRAVSYWRADALERMRVHVRNNSRVNGIVVVDEGGNTVVRVTAADVPDA